MNRKNWERKSHSTGRWFAKLAEEVGEVAKEIADRPGLADFPINTQDRKSLNRAVEELNHVEFIARNFRLDLERKMVK